MKKSHAELEVGDEFALEPNGGISGFWVVNEIDTDSEEEVILANRKKDGERLAIVYDESSSVFVDKKEE